MHRFLIPFVAALSLAACATTPNGKNQVSAAALGTYLVQAGNAANLAAALNNASPKPVANVSADLNTAAAGLIAAGNSLTASGAYTGDLSANVNAVFVALNAAVAGANASGDAGAAKVAAEVQADEAVVVSMLAIYNTGAPSAGLPVIPVPAAA